MMSQENGNIGVNASQVREGDGRCFACGSSNAKGIGLSFVVDADDRSASAEFSLGADFQGWPGIAHGGIVATVVDEAMAYAARACGVTAATGRLSVRYRQPVPVECSLRVYAQITDITHRRLEAVCRLTDDQGHLLAEGTATLMNILDVDRLPDAVPTE